MLKKLSHCIGGTKWANILLIVLSVLAVIIIVEGGARFFIYLRYGDPATGQNKLKYFPYLIFVEDPKKHRLPVKGLNRPSDLSLQETLERNPPPHDNRYRILVLGGSTARGLSENLLVSAFQTLTDKEVEVINLAGAGYIINQELVILALYGINLMPDMIISLDGANDIVNTTKSKRPGVVTTANFLISASRHPVVNAIRSLFLRSQFINAIVKLRERKLTRGVQQNKKLINLTLQQYLQGLRAISLIAGSLEAQHIAVLQPYLLLRENIPERERQIVLTNRYAYRHKFMADTMKEIHRRLSEFTFSEGYYYVDATKAFDESHEVCFGDEVHLTPAGYRILIDYIVNQARLKG